MQPLRTPGSALLAVLFAQILFGCGGTGTGSVSAVNTRLVTRLPLSENAFTGYAYSVSDNGVVCGSEAFGLGARQDMGASWHGPAQPTVLPFLDATTQIEEVSAASPSGRWFAGLSHDNGSGTPERAFVYDSVTQSFHVLNLNGNPNQQVFVSTVSDSGNPSGLIDSGPNGQTFTYDLATDTYQTSAEPDFSGSVSAPSGFHLPSVAGYSANFAFAYGFVVNSSGKRFPTIWNTSNGLGEILDRANPGYATSVSNDGTVAIYKKDVPTNLGELWISGFGSRGLLNIVHSSGLGSDWVTTDFEWISPNGNYLVCTGKVGPHFDFSYPVLVQIR